MSSSPVIAAAALPRLEQVIGLEGAFFYSFLGLIAPSVLDLVFRWERDLGRYYWILIKDVVLIVFGSFVLVSGVTQSLREIIATNDLKSNLTVISQFNDSIAGQNV